MLATWKCWIPKHQPIVFRYRFEHLSYQVQQLFWPSQALLTTLPCLPSWSIFPGTLLSAGSSSSAHSSYKELCCPRLWSLTSYFLSLSFLLDDVTHSQDLRTFYTGDSQIYIPHLDFCLDILKYMSTTSQIFPLEHPTGSANPAHPNTSFTPSCRAILLSLTPFSHWLGHSNSISKAFQHHSLNFLSANVLQCDCKLEFAKQTGLRRTAARIA